MKEGETKTLDIGSDYVYIISEPTSADNFIDIKISTEADYSGLIEALIILGVIAVVGSYLVGGAIVLIVYYCNKTSSVPRKTVNAVPGFQNGISQVSNAGTSSQPPLPYPADSVPNSAVNMHQEISCQTPSNLILPPIRNPHPNPPSYT